MLPEEAIKEFQEIHKKEFGVELSQEDAREKAENLIELFRVVYGSTKNDKQLQH